MMCSTFRRPTLLACRYGWKFVWGGRGVGEFSCQPLGVTGQVAGTRRAGDAGGVKRVATRDERHACESESR